MKKHRSRSALMLAALMVAVMLITALGVRPLAAEETNAAPADTWLETNDSGAYLYCDFTPFTDGNGGTEGAPYVVTTKEQLAALSALVNAYVETAEQQAPLTGINDSSATATNFKGKYIQLANDIDLADHEWVPIGNHDTGGFAGCFFAQNSVNNPISGMQIGREEDPADCKMAGLFGRLSAGGSLENLRVLGSIYVNSADYAAGIAAFVDTGVTIRSCTNDVTILSTNTQGKGTGGLVGYMAGGSIDSCTNDGAVTGESCVGGLVGYLADGEIKGGTNDGIVIGASCVGGAVGNMAGGCVERFTNSGVVIGPSYAGGIVGSLSAGTVKECTNNSQGTVAGSAIVTDVPYSEPTVTITITGEETYTGGVIGGMNGGNVTYCTNQAAIYGANAVGGVAGGMNGGDVTYCGNKGSAFGGYREVEGGMVGGVAGCVEDGNVQNCYNIGSVRGVNTVGGVGGHVKGGIVQNCYNIGPVEGVNPVGGVAGCIDQGGSVSNCYFDQTVYTGNAWGLDSGTDTDATGKTTEQFASGEVAFLLEDGFGQNLGRFPDEYPVFKTESNQVYQVFVCDGTVAYSNTSGEVKHLDPIEITNDLTICGCIANFTGASISVGDDLTLKYYVKIDETKETLETREKLNDWYFAMKFTMNDKTTDYCWSSLDGEDHCFSFEGIPPQCMTDTVTGELYLVNRDETQATLIKTQSYSIKEYAQTAMEKFPDDHELTQFLTDLLHYGAAAQNYKDHNLENMANAGFENLGDASAEEPNTTVKDITETTSDTVYFTAASVWFDYVNRIGVKLSTTEKVTLKVNGKTVGLTGTTYYTDAIYATDFDTVYTFELYEGENLVQTLTYSINSYVHAMLNGGTQNPEMQALARTLYNYGKSAEAYAAANYATITGVSLTVDGTEYKEGTVVIGDSAGEEITLTVYATNVEKLNPARNFIEFTVGINMSVDQNWTINSETGTATMDESKARFKSASDKFQIRFSNDGTKTWIDSGLYVIYGSAEGGEGGSVSDGSVAEDGSSSIPAD